MMGANKVRAGEQHEQWRGVHAAVVAGERNFAHDGHFAAEHFMKDFAGLGIALGLFFCCFGFRKIFEEAIGGAYSHPQTFERGDYFIAAEYGVEPGHAGVGVRAFRIAVNQHAQVRGGTRQPRIECLARGSNDTLVDSCAVEVSLKFSERGIEWIYARGNGVPLARSHARYTIFLFRLQSDLKRRFPRGKRRGLWRKFEASPPQDVVQASIGQDDLAICGVIRKALALSGTLRAAHFKDVREVRVELYLQGDSHGLQAVIQEAKIVVTSSTAQELQAKQVHSTPR